MTLEQKITKLIKEQFPDVDFFDVIAHELWNDGSGWSTNDSWYLERRVNLEYVLKACRERWDVFKLNYCPKALVKDIDTQGETELLLEVHHIPFIDIRANYENRN